MKDTDSILLGLTADSLLNLVREEKKDNWVKNVVPVWFADNTPTGQKTPGFLKEEFTTTRGSFVALR